MPLITAGQFVAFFLFDVAEALDLAAIAQQLPAGPVKLEPKPSTPAYVAYQQPPVVASGEAVGVPELDGFRVRVKFFDYGVVSVMLSRSFVGSWVEFIAVGQPLIENEALEQRAEALCRELLARVDRAMTQPRKSFLSEDYVVFAVTALDRPATADELLETRGEELSLLLRGEQQALSRQEREEVLRNRLSYLADDLVIPTWSTAFVYDTEAGAGAAFEIIEFANSQLLQFRYYDDLLDNELARIYAQLQRPRWYEALVGRRYSQASKQIHSLFIDVTELTDRTENALKMVGDIYAARLLNLVGTRLGVDRWKASVEDKLETLDDVYRFVVDQTAISRGHLLELTIVAILVLELVLFFLGIMT